MHSSEQRSQMLFLEPAEANLPVLGSQSPHPFNLLFQQMAFLSLSSSLFLMLLSLAKSITIALVSCLLTTKRDHTGSWRCCSINNILCDPRTPSTLCLPHSYDAPRMLYLPASSTSLHSLRGIFAQSALWVLSSVAESVKRPPVPSVLSLRPALSSNWYVCWYQPLFLSSVLHPMNLFPRSRACEYK